MNPHVSRLSRLAALLLALISVAVAALPHGSVPAAHAQGTPRTAFVHLFEWKWTDIARECETFLGPKGFAAVQVSPPNEHAVIGGFPWWQRYQPVSYQLTSRSGTRAQFIDMVKRCKAVGVEVYVDAVINHMTGGDGTGSAGTVYTHFNYPNLYGYNDFHHCGRNGNDDISGAAYGNDAWEVRNCELSNLADLATDTAYVRGKIAAYLNDLTSLRDPQGNLVPVGGFRIDAAKHMYPADIGAILGQVSGSPYVYQEIIDPGNEAVSRTEYYNQGDVLEFIYGEKLGQKFLNLNGQNIAQLRTFGETWGFAPSDKAVVFVDNHDKQRGHGGGGNYVTYKNGTLYDLTNVFMLAWPFGYPQVMSSYDFSNGDQGPPSDASGNTLSVYNADGSLNCFGTQWKCEHRWRPIANMVAFRNFTNASFTVNNWWDNGVNQIAFSRGNLGFVVINRDGSNLSRTFQTGLPGGTYCNVIKGDFNNGTCSGPTVTVNADGTANVTVNSMDSLAIHGGAKLGTSATATPTRTPTPAATATRTPTPVPTVAVTFKVNNATTVTGQSIFVVGNTAALGNWDTSKAVALKTNVTGATYPTWIASPAVNLPRSTTIEYKYIKKNGTQVVWESGTNRILTTPSTGSVSLNDTWK